MHRSWIQRAPRAAEVAVALGLGLLAGCANPTDEASAGDVEVAPQTDTTEQQIFGGAHDDDADALPGVVALRVGAGGVYELCTGTLLASNVVLTARHCVTKNLTTSVACDENGASANGPHVDGDEDPANIAVFVGASPRFSATPSAVARAVFAPKGRYLCDSDIAIVVLDHDLTGVEPLAVRLGATVSPGERFRAVGYGQNDAKSPIGTRFRKDDVPVLAMGRAVSASKTPLGPHEFEVARSICQGDSGGPAISETSGAVIGVVSRGGGCDDDYGHIYTTTSGFEDLFQQAFALAGGAPIPEGETAPPPQTQSTRSGSASDARIADGASNDAHGCAVGGARTKSPAMNGAGVVALAVAAAAALRARRRAV